MNYKIINENKIMIGNREVEFKHPIDQVVETKLYTIVNLYIAPKNQHNRNVYGFDKDGNQLWQINDVPYIREFSPFMSIFLDGDKLWAYNLNGNQYRIDPETGEILETEFVK